VVGLKDIAGIGSGHDAKHTWMNEAQQVALGYSFGCAVLRSGQVACWGKNTKGQLGDGTTEERAGSVTATGVRGAALVAAGSDSDGHACAALKSGEIACWGSNDYGQLGDRSTQNRSTAVRVVGINIPIHARCAAPAASCAGAMMTMEGSAARQTR
jgi:alpha-tubulin suppressor-like RCC1 family protein